jgi:adenylate cyclase class IV
LITTAVSGLEKEFPGEVKAENINAKEEDSKKVIKQAGFKNHGLIIRNAKRRIVWKQADHTVKIDDVRAAIRKLLAD